TKIWAANVHKNRLVRIVSGPGVGQTFVIDSNTANVMVIKGTWVTALGTTSEYVILSVNLAQVLRDVFGGGSNISVANPLETHDPTIEDVEAALTAIKGAGWTTETLVAIKAALDAIPTTAERGTDNALLAAEYTAPDNAGIATLLTRITAAVALASALTTHETAQAIHRTALGTHDIDIKAILAIITAYVDELETRLSAVRAGYLDQLDFDLAEAIAAIPT
ncbi:unnamed protein product, partial [marine sediment metagenome]